MPERQHPLGPFVRRFLIEELVGNRNLSRQTQKSYRDTIRLLLHHLVSRYSTDPTQASIEQVDAKCVLGFLEHLEKERGNSTTTRNQRLACLHSFFRFISRLEPELVDHATQIQAIPVRRAIQRPVDYLEKEEVDALFSVPDRKRPQGQRDYTLLLFLYNTGARASETADVTVGDLDLTTAQSVRLCGKGRKVRVCPLWDCTTEALKSLLAQRPSPRSDEEPVFWNVRSQPITRYGIHNLVARIVRKAGNTLSSLRKKRVSPHTLRHTTAVHLLRSGVDINTIRAWLGHVSVETTNRYAQVDLKMKAKALETCADIEQGDRTFNWHKENELMEFLTKL